MFKSKKVVIIVAVLALVGIGGAGMLVVKPRMGGGHEEEKKAEAHEPAHNLVLEDFTVNLSDVDRPRYLKTTMALAFAEESEIEAARRAEPQIRDAAIMILTRQYFGELLTWRGKERLRGELITAVNKRLEPLGLEAQEIVFTAFVME